MAVQIVDSTAYEHILPQFKQQFSHRKKRKTSYKK